MLLLAITALSAAAQPFYAGFKAGVLLTSSSETTSQSGRGGQSIATAKSGRKILGGTVEAGLPAKLRVETGLLYRTFRGSEFRDFAGAVQEFISLEDKRLEVPLSLRREMSSGSVRPFVGAGGVWTHCFRDVSWTRVQGTVPPATTTFGSRSESDNLFGWTGSAGIRFRLPMGLKMTPEIRYTRWTAKRWLPSQNQVDLFLGIGF
jgi:opacity protein-like surface antigen